MKLTEKAISHIKAPAVRRELANIFQCTDQTIIRYINKNEVYGPLTTVGAIKKIKECCKNLGADEILESEQVEAKELQT